jgi:Dolichyl-phosphate-mannose-protein mannosyltransferase
LIQGARKLSATVIGLACALAVGAFLRLYQLGTQILLDDEWHAIHKLLHADARDIATHIGLADYSIPLTLYYQFLYLHGGLSEWGMRLPPVACGIALILIAPWLMLRRASGTTLALWAGLIAISPLMIYHSRVARPYAITTLLVFVAVIAFRQWWQQDRGRWRWALIYGACTFLAGWLHLITLPFTLLPFVFCGIVALRGLTGPARPTSWRDLARLLVLGGLTAVALGAALLPPILNDWGSIAGKAGADSVTLESGYRSLLLCLGVAGPLPFAVLIMLLVIGLPSWWRRDAGFVGYIATVVAGSAIAVALSHPAWVQHPGTYARYMQPAVPFVLLFVAEGFSALVARLAAPLQIAGAALGVAALYWIGPVPGYLYSPNQFMADPYFQFDYDPAYNAYRIELPDGPIPEFYRRLATQPSRTWTLIEAPWSLETNHDPQPLYQNVHRQYIKIGLVTPVCGIRDYGEYPETLQGMQFSQFVHLSAMLGDDPPPPPGDFLVMHLRPWPPNLPPPPQWPNLSACLPEIAQRFGMPIFHDDETEVFALSDAARALQLEKPQKPPGG